MRVFILLFLIATLLNLGAGTAFSQSDETCGGLAHKSCPDKTMFCEFPAGKCGAADLMGTCMKRPRREECPRLYEPVCACDGRTWDNDCFRQVAGAQKDHEGMCTK